jgi:hypothetical protein
MCALVGWSFESCLPFKLCVRGRFRILSQMVNLRRTDRATNCDPAMAVR